MKSEAYKHRVFKSGVLYDEYIDRIEFGDIAKDDLLNIYRDGRVSGLIAELLVESIFSNLRRSGAEGTPYDLVDEKTGEKWEVRVITKGGVKFLPSSQIGVGRKYDEEKFLEKLRAVTGYILVDVRYIPNICIGSILSKDLIVLKIQKMTTKMLYDRKLTAYKGGET